MRDADILVVRLCNFTHTKMSYFMKMEWTRLVWLYAATVVAEKTRQ